MKGNFATSRPSNPVIPAEAGIPFPRMWGKVGWGTQDNINLQCRGSVTIAFNSEGMYRGYVSAGRRLEVAIY